MNLLLGSALVLFSITQIEAVTCPGGVFASVGPKKFYTSTSKVAWQDAKTACPTDTTPATFQTQDEFDQLKMKSDSGKCY